MCQNEWFSTCITMGKSLLAQLFCENYFGDSFSCHLTDLRKDKLLVLQKIICPNFHRPVYNVCYVFFLQAMTISLTLFSCFNASSASKVGFFFSWGEVFQF